MRIVSNFFYILGLVSALAYTETLVLTVCQSDLKQQSKKSMCKTHVSDSLQNAFHHCLCKRITTHLSVQACCDGADFSRSSVDGKHVGNGDVWVLVQDPVVHETVGHGAVVSIDRSHAHH